MTGALFSNTRPIKTEHGQATLSLKKPLTLEVILTPGTSRCRKRERHRSGRWRQSAPCPCGTAVGLGVKAYCGTDRVHLVEAQRAHRPWGPRTIPPAPAPRRPELALPAPNTAGALFQHSGLRPARHRRHRHAGARPLPAEAPKAVGTANCTGQLRPGDGLDGSPVTVADAYRRFRCCGSARLATTPLAAAARPMKSARMTP
jgi:hypothetical protein